MQIEKCKMQNARREARLARREPCSPVFIFHFSFFILHSPSPSAEAAV